MSLNSELEDAQLVFNWIISFFKDYWHFLVTDRMGRFITALFVLMLVFAVFYRLRHIRH